jgi:hypothetical protein
LLPRPAIEEVVRAAVVVLVPRLDDLDRARLERVELLLEREPDQDVGRELLGARDAEVTRVALLLHEDPCTCWLVSLRRVSSKALRFSKYSRSVSSRPTLSMQTIPIGPASR